MKIKEGVKLEGASWHIFYAAIVVEAVLETFGVKLVITSVTDGKHGCGTSKPGKADGTLHDDGLAFDARSRDLAPAFQGHARDAMKERLGPDFDVVLEKDHFHIEWDKKGVST